MGPFFLLILAPTGGSNPAEPYPNPAGQTQPQLKRNLTLNMHSPNPAGQIQLYQRKGKRHLHRAPKISV